jgi:hypothetical protein
MQFFNIFWLAISPLPGNISPCDPFSPLQSINRNNSPIACSRDATAHSQVPHAFPHRWPGRSHPLSICQKTQPLPRQAPSRYSCRASKNIVWTLAPPGSSSMIRNSEACGFGAPRYTISAIWPRRKCKFQSRFAWWCALLGAFVIVSPTLSLTDLSSRRIADVIHHYMRTLSAICRYGSRRMPGKTAQWLGETCTRTLPPVITCQLPVVRSTPFFAKILQNDRAAQRGRLLGLLGLPFQQCAVVSPRSWDYHTIIYDGSHTPWHTHKKLPGSKLQNECWESSRNIKPPIFISSTPVMSLGSSMSIVRQMSRCLFGMTRQQ